MWDEPFLTLLDETLQPLGCRLEPGVEYPEQGCDVLRFYVRMVRTHWLPIVGKALSVVAVVRESPQQSLDRAHFQDRIRTTATVVNSHFPPKPLRYGLTIGLTVVQLASLPIEPEDEAVITACNPSLKRMRCVLTGVLRVNLAQEAMAYALRFAPDSLFPEPHALADALTPRLRRFVPLIQE